jgi:preprotein translocase subunit SecE
MPRPATGVAAPRRRRTLDVLGRLQPRFVADVIAELRKVTWPTFADTRYLTVVVAIVALTVGIFLGLIDLAFGKIIEQLFF